MMDGICPACGMDWDSHWPFTRDAGCICYPPCDWVPIAELAEADRDLGGEG